MLDIKFIRENRGQVKEGVKNKGQKVDIDELLTIDEERRKLLIEVEALKAERNKANNEISALMKVKKNPKEIIGKMKAVSQKIADLDTKVGELDQKLEKMIYIIPNLPDKSVPIGGPEANKLIRSWGETPKFSFKP